MNWRSGRQPSVVLYWRTEAPCSASHLVHALWISAIGKSSGAGSPPAKEIMSGFWVSFNSSRIAELWMAVARRVYRLGQVVFMGFSLLKDMVRTLARTSTDTEI